MDENITDITVQEIVRDNRLFQVMELMLTGMLQKDACRQVGISEKTFNRGVAANKELLKQYHGFVSSHLAELSDEILGAHSNTIETLKAEVSRLSELLKLDFNDVPLDIDERIKIAGAIMKIDKYLVGVINAMYPQISDKGKVEEKDSPADDAAIAAIFSQMQGAHRVKVTLSKQVEVFEETERKGRITGEPIDVEPSELD